MESDGENAVVLTVVDSEGREESFPAATPAETLLNIVAVDYTALRDKVLRLWFEYPLEIYDREKQKAELSRLAAEVRMDAEMLREIDPLGYFYVMAHLDACQPQIDAVFGTAPAIAATPEEIRTEPPTEEDAISILRAVFREMQHPSSVEPPPVRADEIDLAELGATLINVLEEPAYSQVPLHNMFEIAFDGMERATQRERFKLLTGTYPSVVDRHFPARRMIESDGDIPLSSTRMEYRVESLDDLHELLLSLYFAQKKQRIVRCECCWGYFIPSSTRPARFCDRVFDGKSCKDVGPRLKHTVSLDQDEALRVYDTLRHRMTVRQELLYGGDDLGQVNHLALSKWDEAARAARKAYMKPANKLSSPK